MMKKIRLLPGILLIAALAILPLAGCSSDTAPVDTNGSSAGASTDAPEPPADTSATFSYSDGIDDNGYLKGIKALDYVEMFDYKGLKIPKSAHEVSDADIQAQVDGLLTSYTTTQEVDRSAQDGDTLNIDYVGSIDGVEFEGGSTGGAGTDVTIGTTNYIDDFIQQLVGHNAGESFDINVTFPEDYGTEELNGKDAVFAITINKVSETTTPELTDAFVAENFEAENGWKTVAEMHEGIRKNLQDSALFTYVQNYLAKDVVVSEIPESLQAYQEKAIVKLYETYAASYGVGIDEFLATYAGIANVDELITTSQEELRLNSTYLLVSQAIAEDAKITVTDEDMSRYFEKNMGNADYSTYETEFGLPHLKQTILGQMVMDLIIENAILE